MAGGLAGFGARLFVDGQAFAQTGGFFGTNGSLIPTADGLANAGAVLHLEAGAAHTITLIANLSPDAPTQVRLAWITPEQRAASFAAAVEAARAAPVAVVFAHNEGTEGSDRVSLTMPRGQDSLVEAVARVNPHTIVVLNTGDPVTMPWVNDVSPSGKLPVTFPVRLEDNPTFSIDGSRYQGVNNEEFYDEGILVGYRWYDQNGIAPLFPFGHGLSYSQFEYAALEIRRADKHAEDLEVAFTVRNSGRMRATEVAQVYLGPPERRPAPMARRKLVGFARIDLAPGRSERVRVHVDRRELSYWSVAQDNWVFAGGVRPIDVGSSSRDIRLKGASR